MWAFCEAVLADAGIASEAVLAGIDCEETSSTASVLSVSLSLSGLGFL